MYRNLSEEARDHILKLVRAGIASGNRKLPTEREMASCLIASYATVRLVTKQLENEGIITKIRGSGTYISDDAARIIAEQQRRSLFFFHSYALHDPCEDYGAWLIREVEKKAHESNWKLHSINVNSHAEFIRKCQALTTAADSIVYLPPCEGFSLKQIGELSRFSDRPLIVLDSEMGDVAICNISTDNRRGGMIAAKRFLECGVRDIAILISEPPSRQLQSRIQGFCEIAELAGVKPAWIDCHMGVNDDRIVFSRRAMDVFLKDNPVPEGIFIVSDAGAFGALEALEAHHIKIGEEVKIIGFDGVSIGKQQKVSLATVVQPVEEMVEAVFYTLNNWNSMPYTSRQFPPTFREGETLERISEKRLNTVNIIPQYITQKKERTT